jgi:alpha-ketoglutarate-dependent taurine dioxygenase
MSVAIDSRLIRRQPVPGFGFELVESLGEEHSVLGICEFKALYEELSRSGVVIYRGFQVSLQDYNDRVSAHSSRVTLDPARKSATANTAEIDAGRLEMGIHRENGNLPFSPDLQWFFWLEPATVGSETTICDGCRVLYELSGSTRRLFERQKVKFSRRIPWKNVQRFLSVELQLPLDTVDTSHLELVNSQVSGQKYRRLDEYLVHSELTVSAITTSKFSGKRAFCNSLLGPSVNYEPPSITWETGEGIDFDIWDEIKDVTARCTYDLFWQKGDLVVLDNTRAMHGRRRLADQRRRIFGAQSYCKGVEA